ncbi:class I SAM-dependent RNA methyltransferase [Dyadobacter sp. CY323]|uniref:THUMP domain-containing class I SAM-dependent RNA methyltransferase n=1 Tax=Dyadobacter sp. CY323 TaxID=2907302 RepID=UPI001F29C4D7|nr:class I SAM-dependent RNA methyltransferase [Dyadobacter sp. CY323]MCE6987849.1 class I SAM-dependent RNA methyltransferase [Dyadobacter sp. CY323]
MSFYQTEAPITITCNKRLAPMLEKEVADLGFKILETFVTGVRLRGTMNDCIRLNLNLYCASQVLYSLGTFRAQNANDVYRFLSGMTWEDILPDDGYFSVTSNVQNETINNNMFANVKVKDAIVDRIRDKKGIRPATGPRQDAAVVHLYWKDENAEIFIDTSGESLARHGYRKIPGAAPMLEALASATILSSRWDRNSAFVNPMCGSGTLAIEAALIATNSRPGLFRDNFSFMHFQGYEADFYDTEQIKLEEQIKDVPDLRIIATDHSEEAIVNARKNAIAAGVAKMIDFEVCDFTGTEIPKDHKGVFFVNPEYGERLGDETELEETYARIGDFMKQKCGGYYGYIFTGNLDLAKKIGLKPKRRIEFYTGKIDCRLLEYELYEGTRREFTPLPFPEG